MKKTVVIDVVGLSANLIGEYTPFLKKYTATRSLAKIKPPMPALTTSSQSVYVTGKPASENGIVGNGWFDRTDMEIKFWKQSNKLVNGEKIWDRAKKVDPNFTCSKMFWWYNMYSTADYTLTPRPQYHADGVKAPDCYSHPASLRDEMQAALGQFPLFNFWGPNTSIVASKWIADASILTDRKYDPTLTLIYLPHLDYCLQKFGEDYSKIGKDLQEIDALIEEVVTYYESKQAEIIILSEYGINPVSKPIDINRVLRKAGLLNVRTERWYELLDGGASRAFAVADHQIAHVYIQDPADLEKVRALVAKVPGVERVLDREQQKWFHIDHERAGDLVLISQPDSWFTYYYWLDDAKAPDFAKLVEIHRKPGYDPVEMFMDPKNSMIKLRAGYKLLRKKLGFRYLMDVIPFDAKLIKGSHGSPLVPERYYPVCITNKSLKEDMIEPTEVYNVIWNHLTQA